MSTDKNTYFGTNATSLKTESFNISLTKHAANSQVPLHSHSKPYFCLLVSGFYNEKNLVEDLITHGEVLYRTANYEHANSFLHDDSICLNIEINDQEQLMDQNDFKLPTITSKGKGSINIYKILYNLKHGVSKDLLDIYCYEAMISHVALLNENGTVEWIKQITDRINDSPFSCISLEELSLDFGLHPNYIVRKFKETMGMKLSEYLTKTRLEYCIDSMLYTEENFTEIALKYGFYDQSHFNRNFKKQLSTTPHLFRKTIKG